MAEADDWAPVGSAQLQGGDDWQPVSPAAADPPPQAFLDRVRSGQAFDRALSGFTSAAKGFKEGFGNEPVGMSDEHVHQLQEAGIYRDPATGRGGVVRLANESILQPAAVIGDLALRTVSGGVHAIGHIIGQMARDAESPSADKIQSEAINFLNYELLRGDHARIEHGADNAAIDRTVGRMPVEADFKTASNVLYHGTNREFREFDAGKFQSASGSRDAGLGFYFTDDPEIASFFADNPKSGRIIEAQLDIKNPKTIELDPQSNLDKSESIKEAFAAGHDAVIFKGSSEGKGAVSTTYIVPRADQISQQRTHLQYIEGNLRDLWQERGIHPAEAAHDAQTDAFLRHELVTPTADTSANAERLYHEAMNAEPGTPVALTDSAGEPLRAVGAEVSGELPDLTQQPPVTPGRLSAATHDAVEKLFDLGRDAQMLVAPMARGTQASMAIAKDFANSLRRSRWEWARHDADLETRFTPEQRARMFNAMDEESVAIQLGESREHQGLATLEPAERAAVEDLDRRQQIAWMRARDLGMVEGEGIPMHATRMVMNITNASAKDGALSLDMIGRNLTVRTPWMKQRKHMTVEETEAAAKIKFGPEAVVARDIRAVALSTGKLEDAIAGRTLVNNIADYGKRTGEEVMAEGFQPAGTDVKWFTLDHPALKTWRPKFKDGAAVKDEAGNVIFEQVPIYIRGDFEGPLRAVLSQNSGALYGAAMAIKGRTMSLIMNSPLIHNAVEWGRAIPAMPGKVAFFKVYFEGNRAKKDVALMGEAIDAGLVPIGKRFFNQDITSIMEAPNLTPGRSWTSQVLAAVPGLFDEAAGTAVKRAIDKAGDIWHNTLLWDRVADLQMGLYTNFRSDLMAKGVDRLTASRAAAHFANRYAGALPQEAMSDAARKVSNMLLFSRSFTLGNLGVMKDMLTGLPKDVIAQMERDAGFGAGAIERAEPGAPADVAKFAKSLARRKAMAVVALDMAMMYVLNSLLQSTSNVVRGDTTASEEVHGYAERLSAALQERAEHPLKLLQPLNFLEEVSSTSRNEPGRQDRIMIGHTKDGTAIYARNPVGKIGEEFVGYMSGPLDMLRRKLGTIARPAWQIMANDAGFGRKVYDPTADTPEKYLKNMGQIAGHIAKSQVPEGQFTAASDLVKGEGDPKLAALQAVGPFTGVTFSKGAPGGPAIGELYAAKSQFEYRKDAAMPGIRRQIQRGDIAGAQEAMTELGISPALQRFYVKTSLNPSTRLSARALRDFFLYASPEQRERFERAR